MSAANTQAGEAPQPAADQRGRNIVAPPVVPLDAVVLINSASGRATDFSHNVQPYLEQFGVPYTVLDIATNSVTTNLVSHSLIVIGQRSLDTNHAFLDGAGQSNLVFAVSNGVGLVNFDTDLTRNGTNLYSYVQSIFNFTYTNSATISAVSFPPTEPGSTMHYVTALHAANDAIPLKVSTNVAGLVPGANSTAIVLASGKPFLVAQKFGAGRALQWACFDWMTIRVLGPLAGLDDEVWRGFVWAAAKPFVLRSMPYFVCMRVDDVGGPFTWTHIANNCGFKPFLSLFINDVNPTNYADLRFLVTNGMATASPHSFTSGSLIYFNHQTETAFSDTVVSNNLYLAQRFHTANGIPMCKTLATHYSEIGLNAFSGILNWGIEYCPIEITPGQVEYPSSGTGAAWLVAGPYRLYEPVLEGRVNLPQYYSDWLTVPNHPEMSNKLFNCYPEIRDATSCAEFCPDNNVAATISRGVAILKRGLDSRILPVLFTHDWYIQSIMSVPNNNPISMANWTAEMQGITNAIRSYHPIYVHLDYGNQYARALKTSRFTAATFTPSSGQVSAVLSGHTDLDLQVQVYTGADAEISAMTGTFGAFTNAAASNVVATLVTAPGIIQAPVSSTNVAGSTVSLQVDAAGSPPLTYSWYKGNTRLNDNSRITGSSTSALNINGVFGGDAGDYQVVVANSAGASTSAPPAVLTVQDPAITTQPEGRTNHAGAPIVLSVTAVGTTPAYQWLNQNGLLGGATETTYTIPAASMSDAGAYAVIVSNEFGVLTSAEAIVSVAAPLQIQSLQVSGDTAAISWPAVPGNSYTLFYKDSLQDSDWSAEPADTAVDAFYVATNLLNGATQRFFKVEVNP